MSIAYAFEPDLSAEEFRAVLIASTLGVRRPVDDLQRLDKMLRKADVITIARDAGRLVGGSLARSAISLTAVICPTLPWTSRTNVKVSASG